MKTDLKIAFLLVLLVTVFLLIHFLPQGETAIARKPLSAFPAAVEEWKMIRSYPIEDKTMKILKVDDYIMRDYQDDAHQVINLYVGYFGHQSQGKAIHSPRQCMPGAGWTPLLLEKADIVLDRGGKKRIQVQKMLMGKGADRQWCIFWYHGRGRVHGSEYLNKLYLILDGITKRRTDGALVRIILNAGTNPEESLKTVDRFARIIVPGLETYIPG